MKREKIKEHLSSPTSRTAPMSATRGSQAKRLRVSKRDADLDYHTPGARDTTVQIRNIFDECTANKWNPLWLAGLLVEEMYKHDMINEFQQELFRRELGL